MRAVYIWVSDIIDSREKSTFLILCLFTLLTVKHVPPSWKISRKLIPRLNITSLYSLVL
jgi:hypothetical protein